MKPHFVRIIIVASLIFAAAWARPLRAQAPLEPSQLPPRTMFYVIWRGAPASQARAANSLLALWDDPDLAPVRSALAAGLLSSSGEKSAQPKLTPEELGGFASLLENSFTLGYIGEPAKRRAATSAAPGGAKPPAWNGMFFVYNRASKEALLTKAILLLRSSEKDVPRLSQVVMGGVQVLKLEHKAGSSYWAENGKYAIGTGEAAVMEELLARLANPSGRGGSLAQSAAYQEAQPIVGNGLLEFFLRIPDLKELAEDSNAGPFKAGPVLDALRLDAVHSLSGHVTLEGSKTHVQAAILGETAPGTPFDIWPSGQPVPASLALVPADAVSYHSGQINLPGIYDTVKRVARSVFPAGQQGNADLLDTIAAQRLGMPLGDALGVFTGEFASSQTSASLDSAKQVFFFGIRKKPETLKLFRSVFGDQLTSERNEGDTTFLKISLGGNQGNAGVAQWNFFHLAVTPEMVLGASRVDTLRDVLANRAKISATGGLAGSPQFQAGRSQFPETLNGLSFFDFQKVDWPAAKERWINDAKKTSVAKSASGSNPSASSKLPDWLSQMDARVFSRHLHSSWSASWKDAKGIHWDQWIE
jgi:hypothetical protein